MVFLKLKDLEVDNVIELPGAKSDEVLADIERFWDSRELYEKHGVLYKRGILLYGPQGSGKTVTIKRVSDAVIARNGVVLHSGWPSQISTMIEMVRSVEPDRPIVAVIEDIDTCIAHGQEANLLSLLDGEGSVTNIVYIGTTNYPDKLPPRVVNRPSRFDERIMIDMPSLSAREAYLRRITNNNPECDKWAKDTDGFSIAHLKELVVAIHCLHKPYEDTLVRLYAMRNKVPMIAGFNPTPDEEDEDL